MIFKLFNPITPHKRSRREPELSASAVYGLLRRRRWQLLCWVFLALYVAVSLATLLPLI